MRIVITYAQVTSQLGGVLSFQYPPAFAAVVDAIRPIMDVWGLLFRALGSSECFGLVGFTSRWTLRVVVLPVILSLVVAIIYCLEKGKNPGKAGSHAKGNLFFAVFFVSLATPLLDPCTHDLTWLRRVYSVTRRSAAWSLRPSSVGP